MATARASSPREPWFQATGRGIRIGIVDSGWDFSIGDPRVERGIALVSSADPLQLVVNDDDQDRNGHGTECADLVLQVAPESRIVPIRVFGPRLETSPEVIVAALLWARDRQLDVVNLSLGTRREDALLPLYKVCASVSREGTLIVAAASPGGHDYPSVFETVLGVGHAPLVDRFAVRTDLESMIECRARGVNQRARSLGGREVVRSGTSFAAPIVTGQVARILEHTPTLTIDGVRRVLATMPS